MEQTIKETPVGKRSAGWLTAGYMNICIKYLKIINWKTKVRNRGNFLKQQPFLKLWRFVGLCYCKGMEIFKRTCSQINMGLVVSRIISGCLIIPNEHEYLNENYNFYVYTSTYNRLLQNFLYPFPTLSSPLHFPLWLLRKRLLRLKFYFLITYLINLNKNHCISKCFTSEFPCNSLRSTLK